MDIAPPPYDPELFPGLAIPSYHEILAGSNALASFFHVSKPSFANSFTSNSWGPESEVKSSPEESHHTLLEAIKKIHNGEQTLLSIKTEIKGVKESLYNIEVVLQELDSKHYSDKGGGAFELFGPCWNSTRADFNSTVARSVNVAQQGAQNARAFRERLLPYLHNNGADAPSFEETKAFLKTFVFDLDKSKEDCLNLARSFLETPQRVRDTQTRLNAAIGVITGKFDDNMGSLRSQIQKVDEEIAHYAQEMKAVIWLGSGGNHEMYLYSSLVSMYDKEMIMKEIHMTRFLKNRTAEAEARREGYRNLLNEMKGHDLTFRNLDAKIEIAWGDASVLCTRLNTMGSIWAVLRTECDLIHQSMVKAEAAKTKWTLPAFLGENNAVTPYKMLEEVLDLYAKNANAD